MRSPQIWTEFNYYFDGLTLLKAFDLYALNNNIQTGPILTYPIFQPLVACFMRDPTRAHEYFKDSNDVWAYRPNIHSLSGDVPNLYKPREIIQNLLETFHQQGGGFENIHPTCPIVKLTTITLNSIPIDPIIHDRIPTLSFTKEKCYFMDFGAVQPKVPDSNDCATRIPNGIHNINILPIREVYMDNIFSFSLFIAPRYVKDIFRWFYDENFIHKGSDGQFFKERPDAFYTWYLRNQLEESILLITDKVKGGGDPVIQNQWTDFGCLMSVDEYVLKLPMLVDYGNDTLVPCSLQNFTPINVTAQFRKQLSKRARQVNMETLLKENDLATVQDYILWSIDTRLSNTERHRFGLYRYRLPQQFIKEVTIPVIDQATNRIVELNANPPILNSTGMLGSVIRFTVLQDPQFNCVLFRDAHSTMPNRNYKYDRSWYNTWRINTGYRIWTYQSAFYNPPHADGQKAPFAAVWGVCKRHPDSYSLFTDEEYRDIFGFQNEDAKLFYGRTSYGVDERLMYRITNKPIWNNSTYFVGVTHLLYLVSGQDNPRSYRIFKNRDSGTMNPDEMVNFQDNKNMIKLPDIIDGNVVTVVDNLSQADRNLLQDLNFTISKTNIIDASINVVIVNNKDDNSQIIQDTNTYNRLNPNKIPISSISEIKNTYVTGENYICRKMDFILSSKAMYTDMRCIFLMAIQQFASELGKRPIDITVNEYFNKLDDYLLNKVATNLFTSNLIKMLPPRWNLWNFLFTSNGNNPPYFYDNNTMLSQFELPFNWGTDFFNLENICNINRLFWIGNNFNYDMYFTPQNVPLPPVITQPPGYPYIP